MRGAILDLLNDWRDSIYFGVVGLLTAWAAFAADALTAINVAAILAWGRELARDIAWAFDRDIRGSRSDARQIFIWSAALLQVVGSFALDGHHSAWSLLIMAWDASWLILPLRRIGFRQAIRLWWRDLFDWPRKQKPPKHRWDAVKRKVEDVLAKFRPDHVPQACRVAARSYPETRPRYE